MGEARRRRLMEKKAEKRLSVTRAGIDKVQTGIDKSWSVLERLRKEFDEASEEYQQELWGVCDLAGPEFFPDDNREIARLLLDSGVFEVFGRQVPQEIQTKLLPRLAYHLQRWMHDRTGRLSQGLQVIADALKRDGLEKKVGGWNQKMVQELFASIYAQRMLHEAAATAAGHYVPFTKIDWKKHMTKEETIRFAKNGINAFNLAKTWEDKLTGRAKAAQEAWNALPRAGKEQILLSLEKDDDGDFQRVRKEVLEEFADRAGEFEHAPDGFMGIFDMVRRAMKNPTVDEDVDVIAYVVAERIFRERWKRAEEDLHHAFRPSGVLPGDEVLRVLNRSERQQVFEERTSEMQENLTGTAKEARDSYLALEDVEKKALKKVVDGIPPGLVSKFEKMAGEWLEKSGTDPDDPIDFQLLFDGIHGGAGLEDLAIEEHLKLAYSYLVTEKLLIAGFQQAENNKMEKEGMRRSLFPSDLWADSELMHAGLTLWEKTYKIGGDDSDAVHHSKIAAKNWGDIARERGVEVNDNRISVAEAVFGFTAKWAVHAFQRITTTHTYAAALMCTDASRDVLQDIELQWHAFMVCLPNGLLSYYDEELGIESEYSRVLVACFDNAASIVLLNQNGEKSRNRLIVQVSSSIADLLDTDVDPVHLVSSVGEDIGTTTREKVRRIFTLAKRLVVGLLLALQNQNNFKSKLSPARDGKKLRDRDEPQHRVVFIGSPLKVDCRPQVKDYIANGSHKRKGAPPAVQYLVRGHHKRQVMGVGRMLRKVIWVEPYWRGPEDAPILTRPKQVAP